MDLCAQVCIRFAGELVVTCHQHTTDSEHCQPGPSGPSAFPMPSFSVVNGSALVLEMPQRQKTGDLAPDQSFCKAG